MPLYAYNKTTAPLTIAGGFVTLTLVAPAFGARSRATNVSVQLHPDLTVDPDNGTAGGLTAANYAAIKAQVATGVLDLQWSTQPEYLTSSLLASDVVSVNYDNVIFARSTGNDDNPGNINTPCRNIDRAIQLALAGWKKTNTVDLGTTKATFNLQSNSLALGKNSGPFSSPLLFKGGFSNELGQRNMTAGSDKTILTDSTLNIRHGFAASVVAGAVDPQDVRVTGMSGWTANDVNSNLFLALGAGPLSQNNNGRCFTITRFVNSTTLDIRNPQQGNVPDPNNTHLYWQESFETDTVTVVGGPSDGQRRTIAGHGLPADDGSVTCVAKASLVNNDRFFVPDGLHAGMNFEFKVSGGFVPAAPLPRTTIDVTGATTAASVAALVRDAINALTPFQLAIQAWNQAGTAVVLLENRLPGAHGNLPLTENVADAGFTVTPFTNASVGEPYNTVLLLFQLSDDPNLGDDFIVEKATATITYGGNESAGQVFSDGQCGFYGVKLRNISTGAVNGYKTVLILRLFTPQMEGFQIDTRGGDLVLNNGATLIANSGIAFIEFNNNPATNPFKLSSQTAWTVRNIDSTEGLFGLGVLIHPHSRISGAFMMRNSFITADPGSNVDPVVLNTERSTISTNGAFYIDAQSIVPAKMDGQWVPDPSGVLLSANDGGLLQTVNNIYLTHSAGRGLEVAASASGVVLGVGGRNATTGMLINLRSGLTTFQTVPGGTVSGEQGDMEFGNQTPQLLVSYSQLVDDGTGVLGYQDTHGNRVDAAL